MVESLTKHWLTDGFHRFLAFKGFQENAIFLPGAADDLEGLSQKHVAGENLCR